MKSVLNHSCFTPDRNGAKRQPVPGGGHWPGRRPHHHDRKLWTPSLSHQAETKQTSPLISSSLLCYIIPLLPSSLLHWSLVLSTVSAMVNVTLFPNTVSIIYRVLYVFLVSKWHIRSKLLTTFTLYQGNLINLEVNLVFTVRERRLTPCVCVVHIILFLRRIVLFFMLTVKTMSKLFSVIQCRFILNRSWLFI